MTGNEADAGDIVSEAFMRALTHFRSYDPTLPFGAWLSAILRNVYLTSLTREAARRSVSLSYAADSEFSLADILPDTAPGPERMAIAADESARVQNALLRLSPAARLAVTMVDLEGAPREEAASVLGCSLSALDVRLHRGRERLKELLS